MLAKLCAMIACVSMTVSAIGFEDTDYSNSASYFESPVSTVRESDYSYGPSPLKLYYDYRYGEYYGGQTVVAIIFLDILIPIVCCIVTIWVIVCIVRAHRRNRDHGGHHGDHHDTHHGHHGTHGATVT